MSDEKPPGAAPWEPLPPWLRAIEASTVAERERWPHALLLAGPRGIGKRLLALHLAQALLCEAPLPTGAACGSCVGCNLVMRGTHPDLRLIEPIIYNDEGDATSVDSITVEPIRELVDFALLSSHRGRAKVAVIAPAEALNGAAANALLKTLEEPPAGTYLMLVTHQPGRLPATLVSRCRRLPLAHPDAAVAEPWLTERGVANAAVVLAQVGGAPWRALEIADADVQRNRNLLLAELARPERLSPVAVGARLDALPKDQRKTELAAAISWLLSWTADLAAVASGGEPRFHPDRRAALANLAGRVARVPLFRYYQSLLRQRALLSHPLQPRLVAETLMFEYRDLFARSKAR
ncbi:MAG: DNA polymerase III subunit delta' [Casimicrobiaceae bacterium]